MPQTTLRMPRTTGSIAQRRVVRVVLPTAEHLSASRLAIADKVRKGIMPGRREKSRRLWGVQATLVPGVENAFISGFRQRP
jgi:hypothetical protein